jgi:transcription termination factor Rho
MYDILELNNKLVGELKEIAKKLSVADYESLRKQDLIYKILDQQAIKVSGSRRWEPHGMPTKTISFVNLHSHVVFH